MRFVNRKKGYRGGLEVITAQTAIDSVEAEWIVLAPDGRVSSSQGDFVVDAESGRLIMAMFERQRADLVIDFEHQTLGGKYARPDGMAPAAGWIKAMRYRPGLGVEGLVEWTADAVGLIDNKQYKYLSPVVVVRKSDRKAIGLHSVGLTNTPAIQGMEALAASGDLESLLKNMEVIAMAEGEGTQGGGGGGGGNGGGGGGAATTAPETEAKMSLEEFVARLRSKLDLGEEVSLEDILLAVEALLGTTSPNKDDAQKKPGEGGDKTDLRALVAQTVREEVKALKEELTTETGKHRREAQVEHLIQAKVMSERHREHALGLNDGQFAHFLSMLPGQARPPAGQTEPPDDASGLPGDPEERLVAVAMKEHDDNYAAALLSVQKNLIDQECERTGCGRERAVEALKPTYPKIFGE